MDFKPYFKKFARGGSPYINWYGYKVGPFIVGYKEIYTVQKRDHTGRPIQVKWRYKPILRFWGNWCWGFTGITKPTNQGE